MAAVGGLGRDCELCEERVPILDRHRSGDELPDLAAYAEHLAVRCAAIENPRWPKRVVVISLHNVDGYTVVRVTPTHRSRVLRLTAEAEMEVGNLVGLFVREFQRVTRRVR